MLRRVDFGPSTSMRHETSGNDFLNTKIEAMQLV